MAWAKFWDIMFADFVWLGQNNSVIFFFLHYFHKIKMLYFIIKKK